MMPTCSSRIRAPRICWLHLRHHLLLLLSIQHSKSHRMDLSGSPNYANGRGAASLVLFYALTFILPTWLAVHLKLSQHKHSSLQALFLNIQWMVLGINATKPVFCVVVVAKFCQFSGRTEMKGRFVFRLH